MGSEMCIRDSSWRVRRAAWNTLTMLPRYVRYAIRGVDCNELLSRELDHGEVEELRSRLLGRVAWYRCRIRLRVRSLSLYWYALPYRPSGPGHARDVEAWGQMNEEVKREPTTEGAQERGRTKKSKEEKKHKKHKTHRRDKQDKEDQKDKKEKKKPAAKKRGVKKAVRHATKKVAVKKTIKKTSKLAAKKKKTAPKKELTPKAPKKREFAPTTIALADCQNEHQYALLNTPGLHPREKHERTRKEDKT